jgi:hypothetical protein
MQRRALFLATIIAALALMPSLALAQYPGGGGQPSGGSRGGMGGSSMGRGSMGQPRDTTRAPEDATVQLQIQLVELEEDLRLAPDQRAAWATYADRMRRLVGDIARNRNAMRFPTGPAAQQFDFLADMLRNRLTAFEDVADAGKALYATLTPDQREVADRRLARMAVMLVDAGQASGGGAIGGASPGGRGSHGDPGGGGNRAQ